MDAAAPAFQPFGTSPAAEGFSQLNTKLSGEISSIDPELDFNSKQNDLPAFVSAKAAKP